MSKVREMENVSVQKERIYAILRMMCKCGDQLEMTTVSDHVWHRHSGTARSDFATSVLYFSLAKFLKHKSKKNEKKRTLVNVL
jgi:hypothetical protein